MEFFTTRAFRVLLLLVTSVFLLIFVYILRGAFAPLLLAFILAYILDPLVDWCEKMRLKRGTAIAILYALGFLFTGLCIFGLYSFVDNQFNSAVAVTGEFIDKLVREPWFANAYQAFTHEAVEKDAQGAVAEQIKKNVNVIFDGLKQTGAALRDQISNFFNLLSYLLLVPLYTFFLLLNFDAIVATIRRYLPGRHRDRIVDLTLQVHTILGSFFRGRLIISLTVTIAGCLLFWALQCPMPILFGLLMGLIIIIPFASLAVIAVAGMATFFHTESWLWTGFVVAAGIAIQMFEAYVLTPKIIGERLELHFIVVILSVFVFGELFGFFGVLLSVPLAAVAKILGREFLLPILRELAAEKPSPH